MSPSGTMDPTQLITFENDTKEPRQQISVKRTYSNTYTGGDTFEPLADVWSPLPPS